MNSKSVKNQTAKVYCAEWYKAGCNTSLWILTILFLIIILTSMFFVSSSTHYLNDGYYDSTESYESLRDAAWLDYNVAIGNFAALPERYAYTAFPENSTGFWHDYVYYSYLVESDLNSEDFIETERYVLSDGSGCDLDSFIRLYRDYSQYKNTVIMLKFLSLSKYVLIIFAILAAFYAFSSEYIKGSIKNQLMAPIRRRAVFWGKFLFLLTVETIVFAAVLLIGLIFGMLEPEAFTLVFAGNEVIRTSCVSFYLFKMLGVYILMLALTALSVFCCIGTKRAFFGIFVPVTAYGVGKIALIYLIDKSWELHDFTVVAAKYIPLISLENIAGAVQSCSAWLTIGYNILIAAALIIASRLVFHRQVI